MTGLFSSYGDNGIHALQCFTTILLVPKRDSTYLKEYTRDDSLHLAAVFAVDIM